MKTVPQSFEFWPEFGTDQVAQIAYASRICYKSEDKAQEDERPFVAGIQKKGHSSCLEMANISILLDPGNYRMEVLWEYKTPYMQIDEVGENLLITASVRGWQDWCAIVEHAGCPVISIFKALKDCKPFFFKHLIISEFEHANCQAWIVEPDTLNLPKSIYAKHKFIGVKITTNRAITHEIVRHRPVSYLQESQRYCRYDKDQFGNEVTFIDPAPFYTEGTSEYGYWYTSCENSESDYLKLLETSSPQAARTVLPNSCKTEINIWCSLEQFNHILYMRAVNKGAEPSMRLLMKPLHQAAIEKFPGFFEHPKKKVG